MKEIVLLTIPRRGKNGDRAVRTTEFKDYEIHCREEPGQDLNAYSLIENIDGYDNFHCSIKDQTAVANEAWQRARKLARIVCGSEQDMKQEYINVEECRKTAMAKLTRFEKIALGFGG